MEDRIILAGMMELPDNLVLETRARKGVQVEILLPAPPPGHRARRQGHVTVHQFGLVFYRQENGFSSREAGFDSRRGHHFPAMHGQVPCTRTSRRCPRETGPSDLAIQRTVVQVALSPVLPS